MSNCTPTTGPLDADNDIVGTGTLAAFFATAAITYFSVVVSYIWDALDRDMLNPLDKRLIHFTTKAIQGMKTKLAGPTTPPPPLVSQSTRPPSRSRQLDMNASEGDRENRQQAISDFLMSLSDQQLVTGLAILIAAIAGQDYLSGYEFSVALSLAWFSCTTHLTTLNILCKRFHQHGILRDVRVLGIVGLMILLSYAIAVSLELHDVASAGDYRLPIACTQKGTSQTWELVGLILTMWPIWFNYGFAIQSIYLGPRLTLFDVLVNLGRRFKGQLVLTHKELVDIKKEQQSTEIVEVVLKSAKRARQSLGIAYYSDSFLKSFPDSTYSFSYGVAHVILRRWSNAPEISANSNSVGFGQITTVILLVLPFLAIGESYSEYRKKRDAHEVTQSEDSPNIPTSQPQDLQVEARNHSHSQPENSPLPGSLPQPIVMDEIQPRHGPATGSDTRATPSHRRQAGDREETMHRSLALTALTSVHATLHDFSTVEYVRRSSEIERYFPVSFKALRLKEFQDRSILEEQRINLLFRTELVVREEKILLPTPPVVLFLLHLVLGILGGIFLNLDSNFLYAIGVLFNSLPFVYLLGGWLRRLLFGLRIKRTSGM